MQPCFFDRKSGNRTQPNDVLPDLREWHVDHNLALACVGYGSVKALMSYRSSARRFAVPAPAILEGTDPVDFCVTAMREAHPEWRDEVDCETRAAILQRLRDEAGRAVSPLARRR